MRRPIRWVMVRVAYGAVGASALGVTLAAPLAAQSVAPRAARLTDAVIARDLARLDSLAVSPSVSPRGRALAALAAEAYLQGDDGALVDALARAAVGGPSPARTLRAATWALVDSARAGGGDADLATRVEVALLRAQHPVLGAPACSTWARVADSLARGLRAWVPVPPPPPVIAAPPAPAPPRAEPMTAPAAPAVPRLLRGIPSRVHFALDRADLSRPSARVLDVLADTLRAWPGVTIHLEGHTDPRASAAYNEALSRRRAAAVRDRLMARGIPGERITIAARGKSALERTGRDVVSLARNRRVQFRFVGPDGAEIPTTEQLDDVQLERGPRGGRR